MVEKSWPIFFIDNGGLHRIPPTPPAIQPSSIVKKKPFGRIITVEKKGNREWQFHATKGWRSFRIVN